MMFFILGLIYLYLTVPFMKTDSRILTTGLLAAVSASVFIFSIFPKLRKTGFKLREEQFFFLSSFIYILYFIVLLYFDFISFYLADYDYTSVAEVILETSKGSFFRAHYVGDMDSGNFLAHHFSPGLIFAVPFTLIGSRIFYGAALIFFIGASLFTFCRILKFFPFYQRKILFLFFITGLFTFRLHSSYHFEIMILSFFLIFIYGYLSKRKFTEALGYILCIFMKEDMAVYFSFLSFYFLFRREYARSILILAFSSVHFFLTVPSLQSFADQSAKENWMNAYSYLGLTYREIILNLLKNPGIIAERFNFKVWKQFAAGFGIIPLLSPVYWISVLPIQVLHFLSQRKWHNEIYNYYCYALIGNFLFSFLFSISGIGQFLKNRKKKILFLWVVLSVSFYQSTRDSDFPRKFRTEYSDPERFESIRTVAGIIPPGRKVSAGFDLGAFVPVSNAVYPLKHNSLKEYVLIDEKSFSPYVEQRLIAEWLRNPKNQYILVLQKGSASLYRKIRSAQNSRRDDSFR